MNGFLMGLSRDLRVHETPEGLQVRVPVPVRNLAEFQRARRLVLPEGFVAEPVLYEPSMRQIAADVVDNPLIDLILGGLAFGATGGIGGPLAVRFASPVLRRALIGSLGGALYGTGKSAFKGAERLWDLPYDMALFGAFEAAMPVVGRGASAIGRYLNRVRMPEVFL